MITVNDFFKPIHVTDNISEKDYKKVQSLIQFAKSFSQVTYQSIYLIDYYKRTFLYVSDNPLFLCGYSSAHVLNEGYSYYLKNVPQEDLEMLLKINMAGFEFYNDIPNTERLNYSISYDFHLKQPNNRPILINHKLAPIVLDKDFNIWIAVCIVSLSSNDKAGNIKIKHVNQSYYHEYDMESEKWVERKMIKLNKHEKEILLLSSQGLTIEEIAKRLFVSLDTIKFHRRVIYRKLHAKNITEAISAATNFTLL